MISNKFAWWSTVDDFAPPARQSGRAGKGQGKARTKGKGKEDAPATEAAWQQAAFRTHRVFILRRSLSLSHPPRPEMPPAEPERGSPRASRNREANQASPDREASQGSPGREASQASPGREASQASPRPEASLDRASTPRTIRRTTTRSRSRRRHSRGSVSSARHGCSFTCTVVTCLQCSCSELPNIMFDQAKAKPGEEERSEPQLFRIIEPAESQDPVHQPRSDGPGGDRQEPDATNEPESSVPNVTMVGGSGGEPADPGPALCCHPGFASRPLFTNARAKFACKGCI